jgi:hypothetical protein
MFWKRNREEGREGEMAAAKVSLRNEMAVLDEAYRYVHEKNIGLFQRASVHWNWMNKVYEKMENRQEVSAQEIQKLIDKSQEIRAQIKDLEGETQLL